MKLSKREKRILAAAEKVRDADELVALQRATSKRLREAQRDIADQDRAAQNRIDDAERVLREAQWELFREITEGLP